MIDNLITVKNKIIDYLEDIDGLNVIHGYVKGELTGYPAILVYSAEYKPEWADTKDDIDTYVFTLHLLQEIKERTPAEAERIVDDLLVRIVQKFQVNFTLEGVCDKIKVRAIKGWTDRETPNRAATITLEASKYVSIIS